MKRNYSKMTIAPLRMSMEGALLASSVVRGASVQSIGQEVGVVYDLSVEDGVDLFSGKTFSHEWEEGDPI